jgi:hypothetical protein
MYKSSTKAKISPFPLAQVLGESQENWYSVPRPGFWNNRFQLALMSHGSLL